MLNILPGIAGISVDRHLKISRSAAVELSWPAFWNGLSLRREVSDQAGKAGTRSVVLRDGGLSIKLERLHDHLDLWILLEGREPEVTRDLTDMREVLGRSGRRPRTTGDLGDHGGRSCLPTSTHSPSSYRRHL